MIYQVNRRTRELIQSDLFILFIRNFLVTYIHTYIHTYVRTYVHTYIQKSTHMYICTTGLDVVIAYFSGFQKKQSSLNTKGKDRQIQ